MNQLIIKKRNGKELSSEEISFFAQGAARSSIPDYQLSSFLMAVFFQGMTENETISLTRFMMDSGICYDLSKMGQSCIDKHSTGGVGDKVSFICGPIAASLGIKVPMMCGRGLGHTGGTVDKLKSIPGMRLALTEKQFLRVLDRTGLAFSSQTGKIAPADRKLYALRDVTGTVESLPLITSSIMSKKLATGAAGIVFDVKTGCGAFMRKKSDAVALARMLVRVAGKFHRKAACLITSMDEPLGYAVGNSLEIIESVECLRGHFRHDLMEVSLAVSACMIQLAGRAKSFREGRRLALGQIGNGKALEKLKEVMQAQGGDPDIVFQDYCRWKKAKYVQDCKAEKSGYISGINAYDIGVLCCDMGAGRSRLDEKIDPSAGIMFFRKTGDKVHKGESIARLYTDRKPGRAFLERLNKIIMISGKKVIKKKKVLQKILLDQ